MPAAAASRQAKEQFDQLTEAASTLMDAGETDVYTQNKVCCACCCWAAAAPAEAQPAALHMQVVITVISALLT